MEILNKLLIDREGTERAFKNGVALKNLVWD